MDYKVKSIDIKGSISDFPIEVVQVAVERGMAQGEEPSDVIRSLQYNRITGFAWRDTPEGHSFWRQKLWPIGTSQYSSKDTHVPLRTEFTIFVYTQRESLPHIQ